MAMRMNPSSGRHTRRSRAAPALAEFLAGVFRGLVHSGANSPAEGSGVTIRIRYRILNARSPAGAVSAGQGGGVDQAYDGWRVVSQFEFQQWVERSHSHRSPR
jgi:hypothetical protein